MPVENFRLKTAVDKDAAKKFVESLMKGIHEIFRQNASNLSFQDLYHFSYVLSLNKHGKMLYEEFTKVIRLHMDQSLVQISSTNDESLLNAIIEAWSSHKVAFEMIRDVLMFTDKNYILVNKLMSVYDVCLQQFREVIIFHAQVRKRMRSILLENVLLERQGRVIDRGLTKSVLCMLVELNVDGNNIYETDFEQPFLEETKQFYSAESIEFLSKNTCQDYITKVEVRLQEETTRVQKYLYSLTESKLRNLVESELIAVHSKALLEMENTGFFCMLRDNKINDLKRIYTLFARIPNCLEQLRIAFGKYIKQCAFEILNAENSGKDPVAFLKQLLELKDKFDVIIKESFRSEKKVQKKLKEAFEEFVNSNSRCASHLASYIDDLLRNGIQGISEDEIDAKLEKAIVIFRYFSDKDIFENYYKNLLSKRLLAGKTVSDEIEKTMIAKLKAECGYQFTTKLEGMFVDVNISKSVMEQYKKSPYHINNSSGSRNTNEFCELEVTMLSTSNWPLLATPACNLPLPLTVCCKQFCDFYFDKHNGRKLTWLTHLGSCDLMVLLSSNNLMKSLSH